MLSTSVDIADLDIMELIKKDAKERNTPRVHYALHFRRDSGPGHHVDTTRHGNLASNREPDLHKVRNSRALPDPKLS